jgi:hypothetical protein
MAELALNPLMPEFGGIFQIAMSGRVSWLSEADGRRIDSLLTSLGERLEKRLEAAVHDKAQIPSKLRALGDDLKEIRKLLRLQNQTEWLESFVHRIAPWAKAVHTG